MERDVVEDDVAAHGRQLRGVGPLGDPLVLLEHLEDAVHRGERLLEAQVHPRNAAHRIVEPHQRGQEHGERAHGQVPILNPEMGVHQEGDEDQDADQLHERRVDGDDPPRLQVEAEQPVGHAAEPRRLPGLHPEALHHAVARHGLLEHVGHLGHVLLAVPAVTLDPPAQEAGDPRHHRPHHEGGPGQVRVDVEQQHDERHHGEHLAGEVGQRARDRLLDLVHVVDDPAGELAGGVAREEQGGLPDDVVEQVVADVLDDLLARVNRGVVGEVEADALQEGQDEDAQGDLQVDVGPAQVEPVVQELELGRRAGERRVLRQHRVEDGLDEHHDEALEGAHHGQQHQRHRQQGQVRLQVDHQFAQFVHVRTAFAGGAGVPS